MAVRKCPLANESVKQGTNGVVRATPLSVAVSQSRMSAASAIYWTPDDSVVSQSLSA